MHSLDNGTSILKRGIATMPVSIHRTTAQYSILSNWHHPFKLLSYQSQSSVDLSSWIMKGSIPTFSLNSKRNPFPQNTSTISQTLSGPSIPMVYSTTSDASIFWTLEISDYVFSILTQPSLAGHFGQMKTLHQVSMQNFGTEFQSRSRTTASHAPLAPIPNYVPHTLWTSQATSDSQAAALGIPYPWIS